MCNIQETFEEVKIYGYAKYILRYISVGKYAVLKITDSYLKIFCRKL